MVSFDYIIASKNGLHARPAGLLVKAAQACSSVITIKNKGNEADAKRLFAVIGLNTKQGDTISFSISGKDEEKESKEIKSFCREYL